MKTIATETCWYLINQNYFINSIIYKVVHLYLVFNILKHISCLIYVIIKNIQNMIKRTCRIIMRDFSRQLVFDKITNNNNTFRGCISFTLVRNFSYLTRSLRSLYNSGRLSTRGRVDSSLSALCTSAPRVRSSPALTCLPLTFLALRGQRSTFVAFKRCAAPYIQVFTSSAKHRL